MLAETMRASKNTLELINSLMWNMRMSKVEVDQEEADLQCSVEASLRSAHSQGGGEDSSTPFEHSNDGVDNKGDADNYDDEEE